MAMGLASKLALKERSQWGWWEESVKITTGVSGRNKLVGRSHGGLRS